MEYPAKGTIFAPFETWKSYKPVFLSCARMPQSVERCAKSTRHVPERPPNSPCLVHARQDGRFALPMRPRATGRIWIGGSGT